MGAAWSEHATKLQIRTCWLCTVASTYNVLPECHSLARGYNYQHSELCLMILTLFILCILTELHCSFMTPTNASLIYRLPAQSYIAPTRFSITPSAVLFT